LAGSPNFSCCSRFTTTLMSGWKSCNRLVTNVQ
jgi:hypothetical protein